MAKKKLNYFDCFVEQTEIAIKQADLLLDSIKNFSTAAEVAGVMQKAHDLEHAGDVINHKVFTSIANDFITPIDREDLMMISMELDNIIDDLEAVIQLFYMYDVHEMDADCYDFAEIIHKSCVGLNGLLIAFKNFKKNKKEIKEKIIEVNNYEEEADIMYMDTVRKHYVADKASPMRVII